MGKNQNLLQFLVFAVALSATGPVLAMPGEMVDVRGTSYYGDEKQAVELMRKDAYVKCAGKAQGYNYKHRDNSRERLGAGFDLGANISCERPAPDLVNCRGTAVCNGNQVSRGEPGGASRQ